MPAYVWIALGVFFVGLRRRHDLGDGDGLRAWREARPALKRMNAESAALTERVRRHSSGACPRSSRRPRQLQRDVARLSRSVARARVLFGGGPGRPKTARIASPASSGLDARRGGRPRHELDAPARRRRGGRPRRRGRHAGCRSPGSARASTRAGGSCPCPIARVRNCLTDYRRELETLGAERTLAVATSAVRDAENGEAFLGEIEWSYGFATRLLSGRRGGAADVPRRDGGPRDRAGTLSSTSAAARPSSSSAARTACPSTRASTSAACA